MLKRSQKGQLLKKINACLIGVEKSPASGWDVPCRVPRVSGPRPRAQTQPAPPWHLQQHRAPSLWAESPSPHCPPNLSCPGEAELSVPDLRGYGRWKSLFS